MGARIAGLAMVLAATLAGGKNDPAKPAETRGENESVVITAKVYAHPEGVKELLGSDLEGHYIVVAVEVAPRFGKVVEISRDDFVLKTDKDGEKSTPFAPSQIAGRGSLVIRQTAGGSGATPLHDNDGPILGGSPGLGARPRRLGGDGVGSGGDPESAQAKAHSGASEKENPLLKVLKEKVLPETKTDKPVSGLLYFPMEKQKVKQLELRYDMTGDKIVMRFHEER